MSTKIQNQMLVNGKVIEKDGKVGAAKPPGLQINLADDYKEVRGFGQPITKAAARKMATDYLNDCIATMSLVKKIIEDKTDTFAAVRKENGFDNLKELMNEKNHIISGVFGKEIIMQLLSQKDAEGIRYTVGKFNGKMTVMLTAVEQTGTQKKPDENGAMREIATSAPLGGFKLYAPNVEHDPCAPMDAEVHGNSMTIGDLLKIYEGLGVAGSNKDVSEVLFGDY